MPMRLLAVFGREHVHADAVLAGLEAVELAHQDGRDGEDHDDFNGDGKDAYQGAKRTVDQVADDEFVHAVTSVWEWSCWVRRAPRKLRIRGLVDKLYHSGLRSQVRRWWGATTSAKVIGSGVAAGVEVPANNGHGLGEDED